MMPVERIAPKSIGIRSGSLWSRATITRSREVSFIGFATYFR